MGIMEEVKTEQEPTTEEVVEFTQEQVDAMAEARANDPTEIAATMHNLYLPMFCNAVDNLSSASLKRILKYLVSYPLVDCEIKQDEPAEGKVAYLGNNLVECKFVMIMDTYNQNAKEILANSEEHTEVEVEQE